MNKIYLMIIAGLVSGVTQASEISNTKITRTMMDSSYGAILFIQVEGTPTRTNCHANGTWDYTLATDTDFGKQMLSQLLIAHAANKSVKIKGNDLCPVGSTETMIRLELY
jgi:hypothetical protein